MAADRRIDKIRGTIPISGTCSAGGVWDGGVVEIPAGVCRRGFLLYAFVDS